MDLILIDQNSTEWDYMWNWLSSHPLNSNIEDSSTCLNDGEAWQYMGSFMQRERVIHSFRHRNHPTTKQREDLNVQCSDNFTKDQITKKFRL